MSSPSIHAIQLKPAQYLFTTNLIRKSELAIPPFPNTSRVLHALVPFQNRIFIMQWGFNNPLHSTFISPHPHVVA